MQHNGLTTGVSASELDHRLSEMLSRCTCIDTTNIRSFTEDFCRTFDIETIPRDPFDLLPDRLGIRLVRAILGPTSPAQWMRVPFEDTYVIEYSANRAYLTQLTIPLWHEVFEIVSANERFPNRLTPRVECRLANLFAAYITMPTQAVKRLADEFGLDNLPEKVGVLAHRFGVSSTAMRIRLQEIGLLRRFS